MELTFTQKKSIRRNFGKLKESLSIPNLIEVQKDSFNEFLGSGTKNDKININDEILKNDKGIKVPLAIKILSLEGTLMVFFLEKILLR